MSKKSWADSLNQSLTRLRTKLNRPLRIALVGIGHELRGDDAVGLEIARRLQPLARPDLLIIEAGHAPENHTGPLRRFNPDLVLLIDSAQLNQPPGAIRWLPWQETTGLSASTHTMPPYLLARYLTAELNTEIALIGIQPQTTTLAAPLSPPVQHALQTITTILPTCIP